MAFVYSNGGHAFANRPDDYTLQAGEHLLPEGATVQQIKVAFPNYDTADGDDPPMATPPTIVAAAMSVNVAGGDITSVDGMFNIVAAAYNGVGSYMLFFGAAQPDTDYFAVISGAAPSYELSEKYEGFFVISAKDVSAGLPIDPAQTCVQIFRVSSNGE